MTPRHRLAKQSGQCSPVAHPGTEGLMIRLILISLLVLLGGCGGGDAEEKRGDLSVIAISEESVVFQPLRGEWQLKPELIAGAVSRGLVTLHGHGAGVSDMAPSLAVRGHGLWGNVRP